MKINIFKSEDTVKAAVGPRLLEVLPKHDKPWWRIRHILVLNLVLIVPFFSQSGVGYDGSMMNGLQSLKQWTRFFGYPSTSMIGTINAVYPAGKIVGLTSSAFTGDRYGRRVPFVLGLVLMLLGAGLQGGSQNLAMFIVARLILGCGTGFIAQTSPILLSELSYPTQRGQIASLYFSSYYIGSFIAAWTTYGTFRMQNQYSWRIPSILQALIPCFQLAAIWTVPESPRWLVANNRVEKAREIITKYHAGGDAASPLVDFEMKEIEENIRYEKLAYSQSSYIDLFKTPANRRRTFIAGTVGLWTSWAGNAIIAYYLVFVLRNIGITETSSQTLINALLQVFCWFCAVCAGLMINRIGRRLLWLISSGGMLITFIVWTILSQRFGVTKGSSLGRGVLALIFIFTMFYTVGISALAYAYPIEIFPYTLRSRGLSFSVCVNMCGLIVGLFVHPIALTEIGWKYYIVFCVILTTMFLVVYFFYPETKGRTLEEIAEIFDGEPVFGETSSSEARVQEEKNRRTVSIEHAS